MNGSQFWNQGNPAQGNAFSRGVPPLERTEAKNMPVNGITPGGSTSSVQEQSPLGRPDGTPEGRSKAKVWEPWTRMPLMTHEPRAPTPPHTGGMTTMQHGMPDTREGEHSCRAPNARGATDASRAAKPESTGLADGTRGARDFLYTPMNEGQQIPFWFAGDKKAVPKGSRGEAGQLASKCYGAPTIGSFLSREKKRKSSAPGTEEEWTST